MMKTLFTVVAVSAVAGAASAQSVDMRFLGTGEGRNVRINFDGNQSNVFAGELRHRITSGTAEIPADDYITFCVDLAQHVSSNSSVFNVNLVTSTPQLTSKTTEAANRMATAVGSHTVGNQDSATALQLVLWELLYDFDPQVGVASLDLSSGRFSATRTNGSSLWSGVSTLANNLLTASLGSISSGAAGDYRVLTSNTRQDQIVSVPSTGPLALAAVGGLLTVRRKRSN
ncbi:MAG: hypothetical protein KDB18_08760 [Salinibacterium sp.]|nr:hypothetical protein [Salinibacterium sp.]